MTIVELRSEVEPATVGEIVSEVLQRYPDAVRITVEPAERITVEPADA